MRKIIAVLLFLGISSPLLAAEPASNSSTNIRPIIKWDDALSRIQHQNELKPLPAKENQTLSTGDAVIQPQNDATYEVNRKETAHSIILRHLNQIKRTGRMYNTITSDDYWIKVFENANCPDLYEEGRSEITRALEAGLAPYHRGETVTATQFADLAIQAIDHPMTPLASVREDLIIKPLKP